MNSLSPTQRRELRARAHALSPVAMISDSGLSASVMKEIERGLKFHELIKIRVFGADRDSRDEMLKQICEQTGAQPVQHIGKILVVFREKPEEPKARARPARAPLKRGPRRPAGAAPARDDRSRRPSGAPRRASSAAASGRAFQPTTTRGSLTKRPSSKASRRTR